MNAKVKKVLLKSLLPKIFVNTDEAIEIARQALESQETHESVDREQVVDSVDKPWIGITPDTSIKRK